MKMITLAIACKDDDAEYLIREFNNSNLAQHGVYTFGAEERDLTPEEEAEVLSQVPEDILDGN